jgi:23S rRNA (adenine2030-N6)-methyltransferase
LSALRPVDRAVFFDTQRDEAGQLRKLVAGRDRTRVEAADGFAGLRALLPPPERRGCVLIDPPYEEREDYARVIAAASDALTRFESGVLLLWLPVKLREDFDDWLAKLRRAVTRPMLASLLWMHPCDSRAALNGSAMVVLNPPYLVEEALRGWLPELRSVLRPAEVDGPSGCEVIGVNERLRAPA